MQNEPQPTTVQEDWIKEFEHDFGAFAIMGKAGRFYNGAFANEARIREAVEFIEKVEVKARTQEHNKVSKQHAMEMAGLEAQIEQQAVIRASELVDKARTHERKRVIQEVLSIIDEVEIKDENQSLNQWKQYKHIRNAIRDKYQLKEEGKNANSKN